MRGRARSSVDVLRVCAVQSPHGPSVAQNLAYARVLLARAAAGGARLALLPEYFFAAFPSTPREQAEHGPAVREAMRAASAEFGIVVAGNVLERAAAGLVNVGVGYERGNLVLEQTKVHPMPREAEGGVLGGPGFRAASIEGHSTGMLVCADILYPEASRILALQGADVLLNPVMSPWREDDEGREARVAMYVARAYDSGAFVVKAAGFLEKRIAGRSLITAPWGVLERARDDFTEELLFADLDFAKLAAFREKQALFPARRPDVYKDLLR